MPVVRCGEGRFPAWCELEAYEIVRLPEGGEHTFAREGVREKLVVAQGACRLIGPEARELRERDKADLDPTNQAGFTVRDAAPDTVLVRLSGHWGAETGGCGVFRVQRVEAAHERGDPTPYSKETGFDNHYHDCDEYWIIVAGHGTAVSEGKQYAVGPGDCVATGMGHHHDFPLVREPVRGVFFETTLEGQRRRGHLWNHTHGDAVPQTDRV